MGHRPKNIEAPGSLHFEEDILLTKEKIQIWS